MLTGQDDLLGHQLPTTFDHVGQSDVRWTERYWYTGHPIDGTDLIFDIGLGLYPNRNVMDCFAGVATGPKQYNFRASRRLRPNPLDPAVGPLKFQVIEGLKLHRITLGPNESAFEFELDYHASLPAAEEAQSYRRRDGRLEEDLTRMTQFGRWSGWVKLEGRRIEVTPERWWGQRDHSWGVRSIMNTDVPRFPEPAHRNFLFMWAMYQFENFGICLFLKERAPGQTIYLSGNEVHWDEQGQPHVRNIVSMDHDIQWAEDPLGQTMAGARLRFHYADGGVREVLVEPRPARYYLKGGLYGGLDGWNHGDDQGPYRAQADVWDLQSVADRRRARTLSDHVCRVTSDGQTGSGITEYGVAPGYPKYVAPQRFPAM